MERVTLLQALKEKGEMPENWDADHPQANLLVLCITTILSYQSVCGQVYLKLSGFDALHHHESLQEHIQLQASSTDVVGTKNAPSILQAEVPCRWPR